MSAIIDNASTIRYQRQASIAQTKSQSGVRQAQRRGPLLYNFFVEIVPVQYGSDVYYAIEDEIITSNYSENVINTTINNGQLTTPRGSWNGTPLVMGDQSGDRIIIDGVTASSINYGRIGDFVQFAGYTKVFQLTADISDTATAVAGVTTTQVAGDGIITLSLNGALPASVNFDNAVVTFGRSVQFNLQIKERPEPEFSEFDIVNYSSASFEEVL